MTSTLNLQTLSAINTKNLAKSGQNPASSKEGAVVPGEFSAMFAALMTGKPGQQVADIEGNASPPPPLSAQALSPTVNIITTSDSATSTDSLLAFARSQGLDESAMALIFNVKPSDGDQPMTADIAAVPASLAASNILSSLEGEMPTLPGTMTNLSTLAGLGSEGTISWSLGKTGQSDGQPLSGAGLKPVLFGLNGVQAAVTMASTPAGQVNAPTSDEAITQNLAATLILGAAEATQWTKRLQLRNASLRADNLTQSVATLSSKLSQTDAAPSAITPVETLVIGQEISGEDLPAIWSQRLGTDGQPGQNAAGGTEESAHAEQALRSEQYEKLSQRLGEALGQRLAAQIARGEWKVELALNPHKLGKIDIQLDMREGALEASFKTSNPMTRDLLIDGMPRLKDVLAQSGMEVAQVNVNTREDRQNGGNPTPGRQQQPSPSDSSQDGIASSNVAAGPVATRRQTDSNDGLDVRV